MSKTTMTKTKQSNAKSGTVKPAGTAQPDKATDATTDADDFALEKEKARARVLKMNLRLLPPNVRDGDVAFERRLDEIQQRKVSFANEFNAMQRRFIAERGYDFEDFSIFIEFFNEVFHDGDFNLATTLAALGYYDFDNVVYDRVRDFDVWGLVVALENYARILIRATVKNLEITSDDLLDKDSVIFKAIEFCGRVAEFERAAKHCWFSEYEYGAEEREFYRKNRKTILKTSTTKK